MYAQILQLIQRHLSSIYDTKFWFAVFFTCKLQGTTASQDTRFSDKEKKLLKQMKFGDSLTQKVSFFPI